MPAISNPVVTSHSATTGWTKALTLGYKRQYLCIQNQTTGNLEVAFTDADVAPSLGVLIPTLQDRRYTDEVGVPFGYVWVKAEVAGSIVIEVSQSLAP